MSLDMFQEVAEQKCKMTAVCPNEKVTVKTM